MGNRLKIAMGSKRVGRSADLAKADAKGAVVGQLTLFKIHAP